MMLLPRLLAGLLALALAGPAAAASTNYSLTMAWTKIASSGSSVDVQNQSTAVGVLLVTAGSTPDSAAAGAVLYGADGHRVWTLTQDLYARALSAQGATVNVLDGISQGGSGGGSGGAVTVADAADTTQGAKADGAATDSSSSWSVVALLKGLYAKLSAATPAGTNIIGKVGIDQTTPGTTNAVTFGSTGTAGDTSITTGGTAQTLFGGTTPINGFELGNPDASEDCWESDSTTAAANGQGSFRLGANGGTYTTPPGYKPVGPVSLLCATTGHKITARRW